MDQLITFLEIAASATFMVVPLIAAIWVVGRGFGRLLEGIPGLVAIALLTDADRLDGARVVEEAFVPLNLTPLEPSQPASDPRGFRGLQALSGRQQFQ